MMNRRFILLLSAACVAWASAVGVGSAGTIEWKRCMSQKPAWYGSQEAARIAGNVLLHQRDTGGWPKNIDMARVLSEAERAKLIKGKSKTDSTIDNSATYTQMRYLARVQAAAPAGRLREGFLKGLDYLLAAQYPNGGWPQFYPNTRGYYGQITFNDGAMIGAMSLFRDVSDGASDFTFVDQPRRVKARQAVARGLRCILKCQIRVGGKLTAWCAQHDVKSLRPCKARSYELPSISGHESVGIVRFLIGIDQPSAEVVTAVQAAVAWFDSAKLTGIRQVVRPVASAPGGSNKVIVADPAAGPLWGRFYEIGTNRPFFCSRDGVPRQSLAEISHERRNNYAWYIETPQALLARDYPKWQAKHAPGRNVLAAEVLEMNVSGEADEKGAAVCLITDGSPGSAARHGRGKHREALAARGAGVSSAESLAESRGAVAIVAGLAGGQGPAAALCRELKLDPPAGAEALLVHRTTRGGMQVLLVCGSDDRGLMYALLDVARLVGYAASPADVLSEVKDVAEKPAVSERALSKYTMHREHFESCFHDPAYWAKYLDTLAESRFNTFVLILGYENGGYFAPPYPYFVDAEGFDGVRVVGYTPDRQKRNVESLNRIIDMTHERGMNFTLGIWDHIYRGGVQGPTGDAKKPTPGLVWGLTQDNLVAYTNVALARFLQEIRGIDGIQFRMHGESGLKRGEMGTFWTNVFRVMNARAKGMRFDARAKEFPDSLIDKAVEMGVPIRICTKYWAEQMGLPFHPTHVNRQDQHNRRHGYADLLRYPRRYKMHWRLWTGGTTRVLLWGDPDYVRRFADSTHLYDGDGFEVNEPLATKMQDHPHDEKPFDLMPPGRRYYTYEFERYWHFFQLFGRLGYNPNTPAELWDRQFERRFGKQAGPLVERGLHAASKILPRINACVFPYRRFPTTRGWAEKQRRGDLPQYSAVEASDTEQFLNMREAARLRLEGKASAKVWPEQTARWFAAMSAEVLRCAAEAEKCVGDKRNREFESTIADLRILANLSEFHARRIPAGLAWCRYELTKDPAAMDEAIIHEARATEAWEAIVAAAGDFYAKDLKFGRARSGLSGHWSDELAELKAGLAKIKAGRARLPAGAGATPPARAGAGVGPGDVEPPVVTHEQVTTLPVGKPLKLAAEVRDASGVQWVHVRYRGVTQHEDYRTIAMSRVGKGDRFEAVIPAGEIDPKWDFMYFIEAMDAAGNGCIWPDLLNRTPYVIVRLERRPAAAKP